MNGREEILAMTESKATAAVTNLSRHERCFAAIAGKPLDRFPTYIPAIACDVTSRILGRPAFSGTGSLHYAEVRAWAQGDAAHADFEAQFLDDISALYRALDIDVFRMPVRMNVRPAKQLDELTFLFGEAGGDQSVWRYSPETGDFAAVQRMRSPRSEHWLANEVGRLETELDRMSQTPPSVPEEQLRTWKRFGEEFFVVCNGGGICIGFSEDDFMALAESPELMRRKLRVQAENGVRLGIALAQTDCPRVMLGGGDLASDRGLFYSMRSFREVVFPSYSHLLGRLNELGVHYVFRSDGNLCSIADLLFGEAACPGYGEVDRNAGMTVARLRKQFPKLVLWGNVASSFLQHATPPQVKEECRRILDETGGTGYFHGCSNAIVRGTPPANVEAMFSVR